MSVYEVSIVHEYRVIVEARNKGEAKNIVEEMMAESSPEIEYIGFEIIPTEI